MPRIRTVKPEIHQDEAVGELSDSAFRLFIGIITLADDHGRLKGDPRLLGAQVWPYHPRSAEEVKPDLEALEQGGLIHRYRVENNPYISLPTWTEHQRVDNAGKSRIPEPDEGCQESSPRDSASRGGSRLDQGSGNKDQGSGNKESPLDRADAPLCFLLADLITQNGSRQPRVGKRWQDAERLLLERDKRDRSEAERLIRWCQSHEFWRGVILSMPKFREKYDQLRLQAERQQGGRSSSEHPAERRIRERLGSAAA